MDKWDKITVYVSVYLLVFVLFMESFMTASGVYAFHDPAVVVFIRVMLYALIATAINLIISIKLEDKDDEF